uniref:Myosin_tail_1 domain-containing protein n=1 Tax=Mesocestoides corti TaxID=53468 RepID=A0A5K3EGU9_MESCO
MKKTRKKNVWKNHLMKVSSVATSRGVMPLLRTPSISQAPNHKVELRKVQAKTIAAEKIKRERWEAARTKTIKELTMRGVEREVQRIMATHKEEIQALKRQHKEELEKADARAFDSYTKKLEEACSNLSKESEEACVRERKLITERYEALMAEERLAWEGLKMKLTRESADEKDRLMAIISRERIEFEKELGNLNTALVKANEEHDNEMTRMKRELMTRHTSEIEALQSRLEVERSTNAESICARVESELLKRECEIVERLRKEKDHQLDAAIKGLEAKLNESREEAESSAKEKVRQLKEQHLKDIGELEVLERQTNERYLQMRARCVELERDCIGFQERIRQLEGELKELRSVNEKLTGERECLKEVVRQELMDQLVESEAQVSQMQRELAQTRAQANAEVSKMQSQLGAVKRATADGLQSLHERIKEAITKKNENIKEIIRLHEKEIEDLKTQLAIWKNRSAQNKSPEEESTNSNAHFYPSPDVDTSSKVCKRNAAKVRTAIVRRR